MSSNDYVRGFSDALEYVLGVYNRLMDKNKIPVACGKCKFVKEVGELMLLAKDKQFEKIANDLGYYLR